MGTEITPSRQSLASVPAPMHPALDKAARFCASRLTAMGLGHEISVTDAPSQELREAMKRRVDVLAAWLAPAGAASLIDEMTKIMLMPSRSGSTDDAKVQIKLYASDLAGLPMFAVVKACADYRQGREGDGKWRPTQGEIRLIAEAHLAEVARERIKLENVLKAKINYAKPDPARRKEVADKARAIAATFEMNARKAEAERLGREAKIEDREVEPNFDGRPEAREAYYLAKAEAVRDLPPVTLSPSARKSLGLTTEPEQQGDAA